MRKNSMPDVIGDIRFNWQGVRLFPHGVSVFANKGTEMELNALSIYKYRQR